LAHIIIASFRSVAEQIVVAVCIIHTSRALVVVFITFQRLRARNVPIHTALYGIARLGAVAEHTVVAVFVVRCILACVGIHVARVDRTVHPVVANFGRSRHAHIVNASFHPVAEQTVVTVCIDGATDIPSVLTVIFTASEKTIPKCQPRAQNHS
jgi:hypothetical protein